MRKHKQSYWDAPNATVGLGAVPPVTAGGTGGEGHSVVQVNQAILPTFSPMVTQSPVFSIRAERAAQAVWNKIKIPTAQFNKTPEKSRTESQQTPPANEPQKGDCSGPATAITIITPADL